MFAYRFTSLTCLLVLLSPISTVVSQEDAKKNREQIGEVLGKPVYRDEIRTVKDTPLRDELQRLFSSPVMQKYREKHKADIEPTKEEIDAVTVVFDRKHQERIKPEETELRQRLKAADEQLAKSELTKEKRQELEQEKNVLQIKLRPPGRFFSVFLLNNWKFQRHLYDQFGGGRILFQQAGLEAFDAMHQWLKDQEKKGEFRITDPKLRATFYEYWTTMNHGSFLNSDKDRIRTEFLEPDWAPKKPIQAKP